MKKCSHCRLKATYATEDKKEYFCENHAIEFLSESLNPGFLARI
jgi:hypothetical protein